MMSDWSEHLEKTSRTFALAIPLLPEPLRTEVTLAYLLFRVADTLEDASAWPAPERSRALRELATLVREPEPARVASVTARWIELGPSDHPGYVALLEALPALLRDIRALGPRASVLIEQHAIRTIERMDAFVQRADDQGRIVLRSADDLQAYCYAVAGIVGELLTELFVLREQRLARVIDVMRENAAAFGEGLQLVNIARDAADDAREGRAFIPMSVTKSDVFSLAHKDLDRASVYVDALRCGGASAGVVAFVALPVALARATLDRVRDEGAGAKLSRDEVATLFEQVITATAAT